MSRVALVAVLVVAGCSPRLESGAYDCTDGACPDGWSCRSDSRCYAPSDPGFDLYQACQVDSECASGICARPYDDDAVWGQCAQSCNASNPCPELDGRVGVCADGECVGSCADPDDCAPGMSCLVVPMTPGERGCMEISDPVFQARAECAGQADCPFPLECILRAEIDAVGICAWPCSPDGECPLDDECLELPAMMGSTESYAPRLACLTPCGMMLPGTCMGLSCEPFPDTAGHCVPAGWPAAVP